MSYSLEIKYYNSFWLKHVTTPSIHPVEPGDGRPSYCSVFPGFPYEKNNTLSTSATKPNWPFPVSIFYTPTSFYSNVFNEDNNNYNKNNGVKWIIEESRIKGGFNNAQVDLGVRAYLKEDSNDVRNRPNALIYSGIFNSNTNVNNTNVFSVAEDITKAVDPHNGSIQLIYAMDNNLTIFQENKVSTALIDKDAIYSAEGAPMSTQSDVVVGQVTPYTGDYGISRNPESFAYFGFRRYFTDKDRNAVLRLSRDGITEISAYGMKDYFRDELAKIADFKQIRSEAYKLTYNSSTGFLDQGPDNLSGNPQAAGFGPWVSLATREAIPDVLIGSLVELNLNYNPNSPNAGWINTSVFVTGIGDVDGSSLIYINRGPLNVDQVSLNPYVRFVYSDKDNIIGGYDNYKSNYVLSLQKELGSKTSNELSDSYNTLCFDETVQGWTTFYTYRPNNIFSLKNNFYTTKEASLYRHYDPSALHNSFYGADPAASSITFVFNGNPSINKNFKTINYEGTNGWKVDSFSSGDTQITSGTTISNSTYGGSTSGSSTSYSSSADQTNEVLSFEEGGYIESGVQYRQGFYRKNNKYYANLVNNSQASQGEVNFGPSITGIKGFFATVKMSTDNVTDVGGVKELFAASTEFVLSR
jgi:hypothetical protein